MLNLEKREKILLVIMILALIGYLYFKFFLSPILEKINATNMNIDKLNGQLFSTQSDVTLNKSYKKQLEDLKTKMSNSINAIPNTEKNPEIIYNLKTLADKAKVTIATLTSGTPTDFSTVDVTNQNPPVNQDGSSANSDSKDKLVSSGSERLNIVPVTISVLGDYSSIMNFVSLIEKDSRIAEVSNISIGTGSNAGGTPGTPTANGQLSASITINYYYINSATKSDDKYDFNKNSYGKDDLFK